MLRHEFKNMEVSKEESKCHTSQSEMITATDRKIVTPSQFLKHAS